MAPRPYCDKSLLPSDSNESISEIPTHVLPESPTPSTISGATTPSPTPQEVIPTESYVENVCVTEGERRVVTSVSPCYPTPGDIMPYDHSLPDFIRQITNEPNLANLQCLSLRVISTLISLHRMSTYLPNLRELDLEGSVLNSLRDIGCSLKNLQILKVGSCQLESLDGTFGLTSLRELYAQKNFINDVSPCSNLPHIRHIDVSGNRIRNISYVGFLCMCSKLRSIVFTGNPATEVSEYRKHVRRILPQIETLDNVPFLNEDNVDEAKEGELVEHFCEGSTQPLDFSAVSPSDTLNNFLGSDEDSLFVDKRNKHAKNITNQDQFEATGLEIQVLTTYGSSDDFLSKARSGVLEKAKINENKNVRQKCTSIQKLDKDIENRTKKSNLLLKANFGEDLTPASDSQETTNALTSKSSEKMRTNAEMEGTRNYEGLPGFQPDDVKAEKNSGAIKKRSITTNSKPGQSEEVADDQGESKLNKGLPVCGNLTAALINRKKLQNAFDEKKGSKLKSVQNSGPNGNCLQVRINGSGDNLDPDYAVNNEDELIAGDLQESSRKWREAFRRYRSNNRAQWEEEERAGCSEILEVVPKLD